MQLPFLQDAPALENQYEDDRVLRSYLRRVVSEVVLNEIEPEMREMGELARGELRALQMRGLRDEPVLTQWDPWGNRIDHIELTTSWKHAERVAAERGLVATAYERRHGALSRIHQFALAYLFIPSTDFYGCPLAMTDGAARTLLASGNRTLIERAVPHLTARLPAEFWTSGQWMTESIGGSDVGQTETRAVRDEQGSWRLWGRKWFTSAATSQMALTLARPEGNESGSSGLALFYVETRDERGMLRNIRVNRLKDKLGTRKLPTAELTLEGTPAEPVRGLTNGVREISPMLNITRTWNAVTAVALMRRGITLARDYARRRIAFGAPIAQKPLHRDTLAGLQAEFEGAFHLAFEVAGLIGKDESGELDEAGGGLLRLLTPVTKLTTARQAVAVASEVLEAFGGAGYVEDTGLPELLRDAQVLTIWEGTTNVLSLETLRALSRTDALDQLAAHVHRLTATVRDTALVEAGNISRAAIGRAVVWVDETSASDPSLLEAGARRFALTLGRALELALLVHHAQWALDHENDPHPRAAARRLAASRIDCIVAASTEDSALLADDR